MRDSILGMAEQNIDYRYRHLQFLAWLGAATGLLLSLVLHATGIRMLAWGCLLYSVYCVAAIWLSERHRYLTSALSNAGILFTLLLALAAISYQTADMMLSQWVMTIPVVAFLFCSRRPATLWVMLTALGLYGVHLIKPAALSLMSTLMHCLALLASSISLYAFSKYVDANERHMVLMGNTDSLTKALNRRSFHEVLEAEIHRSLRLRSTLTVCMVDVDFFKMYNDHYGHVQGDSVLENIAQVFKQVARRSGDHVFRYGGEEFCLLCAGLEAPQAKAFAEQLRADVEALELEHSKSPFEKVTVSVGCCHIEMIEPLAPGLLVNEADKALYRAKSNGRNRVEHYADEVAGTAVV